MFLGTIFQKKVVPVERPFRVNPSLKEVSVD
jgi:hypothetical protein